MARREISDVRSSTDRPDVELSGGTVQPIIDADHQGVLSVSVTWTGERTQTFTFGPSVPDSPMYSEDPGGLVLLADASLERADEETWVPESRPIRSLSSRTRDLEPSETVTTEFRLWGDPEHVDSIEAGSYSFDGMFHEGTLKEDTATPVAYDLEVDIRRRS